MVYLKKTITSIFLFIATVYIHAQIASQADDILFTINDDAVSSSEFIRVYKKNLDLVKDDSQKDVDAYLKLYIDYKLKVTEAKRLDLDKSTTYINELNGYRKQLVKNYLGNKKVTERLVKEAYDRISYNVNVSHVLIKVKAEDTDTIAAYNTISSVREQFNNNGLDYIKESSKTNPTIITEDLGWFSGFKMVYDFENVAYNTKVGEISQPFRTRFGYHVLKVNNKRKSEGEVKVGHIMIALNQKDTILNVKKRIHEIYELVLKNDNFEDLAKQFSEDRSSAQKGGRLTKFKAGQLSSITFENQAFSLQNKGDISKPFKTKYGWHIVKLYEKIPIGSFEDLKKELELKIKRDSRSQIIDQSVYNMLRTKYNISQSNKHLNKFVNALNDDFYKKKWEPSKQLLDTVVFLQIDKKRLTFKDFSEFLLRAQQRLSGNKSFKAIINKQYNDFVNTNVKAYYEENLENENQEFAYIYNEYKEGLLLFSFMENEIWNVAQNDSIALKSFYKNNKQQYNTKESYDLIIATSNNKKTLYKVDKIIEYTSDINTISEKLKNKGIEQVVLTHKIVEKGDNILPDNFIPNTKTAHYFYNNTYHLIKVNEVLPQHNKTFNEAKGLVINDYQKKIEGDILKTLAKQHKVVINHNVLKDIKQKLSKL